MNVTFGSDFDYSSTWVMVVFIILMVYFLFRYLLFWIMVLDFIFDTFRDLKWFPGEGKRRRTFIHFLVAAGLFYGFAFLGQEVGWLEHTPKEG